MGLEIKELPRLISQPPVNPKDVVNEIRNKLIEIKKDDTGTVNNLEESMYLEELKFVRKLANVDEKVFLKQNIKEEQDEDINKLLHMFNLVLELKELYISIEMYKIIYSHWKDRREKNLWIRYDKIRNTLYSALLYRIIFGMTKMFSKREENGLNDLINDRKLNNIDLQVHNLLNDLEEEIKLYGKEIEEIIWYRNKLFGHLDNRMVISAERLRESLVFYYIEPINLRRILEKTIKLYNYLYDENFTFEFDTIQKEEVIKRFFPDN